ncbi:MAG: pantoate--beta-alanine ligase [Nocardioidaceae bacterium]
MPAPQVVGTRAELATALDGIRRASGRVALVPTMGALHEGHAALVRRAAGSAEAVVVSVFVNPTQFAPGEDLARYPRTFDADLEICGQSGAQVVFAPTVEEMYPAGLPGDAVTGDPVTGDPVTGDAVTVDPGPLGSRLEGASRPTHFRGVLTVVAKLFGLVRPDLAVFGEKDYQQLTLIRRMVADLCLGIEIVGAETVREESGLALSSRNRYLSPAEHELALTLSRALRAGAAAGVRGADAARAAALEVLAGVPEVKLDYLELAAPDLGPAPRSGSARLLVAARVGTTRLLDNLPVVLAPVVR